MYYVVYGPLYLLSLLPLRILYLFSDLAYLKILLPGFIVAEIALGLQGGGFDLGALRGGVDEGFFEHPAIHFFFGFDAEDAQDGGGDVAVGAGGFVLKSDLKIRTSGDERVVHIEPA